MVGRRSTDSAPPQTRLTFASLEESGFDAATIDAMVAAMPTSARPASQGLASWSADQGRRQRQAEADCARDLREPRTIADFWRGRNPMRCGDLSEDAYRRTATHGAERRVVDRFPVYSSIWITQGSLRAGESRLRHTGTRTATTRYTGQLAQTESMWSALIRFKSFTWLRERGIGHDRLG